MESLSRLPEFQKEPTEKPAPAEEEPAAQAPAEEPAEKPETTPAPAEEPAAQPAEPAEAEEETTADSSEDFWEKDESQLKLDPPPADLKPEEPDYDAFQGVKFSE